MASRPKTSSRRPSSSNDEYVHFSDRLTGALENIKDTIDDNKGTLDSIQDMALQLTSTVILLREIVMEYVEKVERMLEIAIPLLDKIPLIPDKVIDFAKDIHEWSEKIIETSDLAEKVLPGVEKSLKSADVAGLQASTRDVARLSASLQKLTEKK